MNVAFKCNIDDYNNVNCFPNNITIPPRKGDLVMVVEVFFKYFEQKELPIILEVTDVVWTDKGVICDLWFRKSLE